MLSRIVALSLILAPGWGLVAQGNELITNLGRGARSVFALDENWLVYELDEAYSGSLNGDRDFRDSVLHLRDLSTGETTNLGLVGGSVARSGELLVFTVPEREQSEDLSRDGDQDDEVLHVRDLARGETTNLELAVRRFVLSGEWLAFEVSESDQDEDLNDDGDTEDLVVQVHDLAVRETRNLELASREGQLALSENWLVFMVSESDQDEDLNDDDDLEDLVVHVHDLAARETRNLELASREGRLSVSQSWLAFEVSESDQDEDLNGDGDGADRVLHAHDLTRGKTSNLELACSPGPNGFRLHENWLVFSVSESEHGEGDLNGDGDIEDRVLHTHDLARAETKNLELAAHPCVGLSGNWLAFAVSESDQGEDLNGDDDLADDVLHAHDLVREETVNLKLAGHDGAVSGAPGGFRLHENRLAFWVSETGQGEEDLDGDGDIGAGVLHTHDLTLGETTNLGKTTHGCYSDSSILALTERWLLFGSYTFHAHDLETGETTDLGLHLYHCWGFAAFWPDCPPAATSLGGTVLAGNWCTVVENQGPGSDFGVHLVDLERLTSLPRFLRGDCNADGAAGGSVADAAFLLSYNFASGPAPECLSACDANGDGAANVTDAVYLLTYNFAGGPPPAPPFPGCERSATASDADIGCETPQDCQ